MVVTKIPLSLHGDLQSNLSIDCRGGEEKIILGSRLADESNLTGLQWRRFVGFGL